MWKWIAFLNRSRFRKPHAVRLIHWIFALSDSALALVVWETTAFMMPSQCALIIRATFFTGSSRLRIAQLYQCVQAFSAHARFR